LATHAAVAIDCGHRVFRPANVQSAAAVVVQTSKVSGALQACGQDVLQQPPQKVQPFNREDKHPHAGVCPLI